MKKKLYFHFMMKKFITLSCLCLTLFFTAKSQEKAIVLFESNSSTLTNDAKAILDAIIAQKDQISAQAGITIYGHCDILSNNEFNDILSKWRVKSVRDYLTLHGISKDIIKNEYGYGKRKLLNKNRTEEEKAMNRRVEIIYTKA